MTWKKTETALSFVCHVTVKIERASPIIGQLRLKFPRPTFSLHTSWKYAQRSLNGDLFSHRF